MALDKGNGLDQVGNIDTKQIEESFHSHVGNNDFGSAGGLLVLGNIVNGDAEKHYNKMTTLLEDKKVAVDALTQNLDYPLIVYSHIKDGIVFYYPTIVVDDNKKGASVSNFLNSLRSKDSSTIIYTPDTKYASESDDRKVKERLQDKYPNAKGFFLAGTSVVYYSETTYNTIARYVIKLLLASTYVSLGMDQTKQFPKKNIRIAYSDVVEGYHVTDTGISVRADFKLSLNIPKSAESESKNEMNMDYVTCYGYIDLAVVSEPAPMAPNVNPQFAAVQYVNKLSPSIVITYISGASALPGYGMMGLVTSSLMMDSSMYFGYILNHVSKYQDIISLLLETDINFAKMTQEQKIEILGSILTTPAFAVDVPNNGYMEELNFLIPRATRAKEFKEYASRFLQQEFVSSAIIGDVPVPLIEVFDKKLVDSRVYDASKIATLTKNKSHTVAISTYTNDVSSTNADTSIANICDMIQEIGLDGTIAGTIARIFISQEGLNELYEKSEIRATFTPLYVPTNNGAVGAIRRTGYTNASFHQAYQQGVTGRDPRAYQTY